MTAKEFPRLTAGQEEELQSELQQWSLANGLVMYPPGFVEYSVNVAPVTLFPTPIPKAAFQDAVQVQQLFNKLYAKVVSTNKLWLMKILEDLSEFDQDFTGKLLDAHKRAVEESGGKLRQPLSLGLFRSDYMVNEVRGEEAISQIEFNTVSVSFGGLSTKASKLHNHLNQIGAYDSNYSYQYYDSSEIPISNSAAALADGLADGDCYYNDKNSKCNTIILFIVQDGERNCFDQRLVEFELLKNHGIRSRRLTLAEVVPNTTINDGKLYIKSTMDEISVVYYRAGYAPYEYEVDSAWNARLYVEKTAAIKCPTLLTQLSGCKKIQQLLTEENNIQKFLPDLDSSEMSKITSTFVPIYPLDDTERGKAARRLAFDCPEKFVLKPQREGGGNNIYKEDIPSFLKELPEREWGAYILMEMIDPPKHKNKIIRNETIYNEPIVSELGIFGTTLYNEDTGEILTNKNAGWLLRSKVDSSNEGGVAAGFGCIDSIYLY
ncbi:uncharacterized protein PRCAT00004132001 [Priceomyces carsonii]|uniref:uncharacterized protein n=1 Tax=Priceomyces carsonii TaxID=28549 RepID=UPI002ED9DB5D|nr:unnamed protein product [Priceomyces carsonii]